jgi:hypothetical protein
MPEGLKNQRSFLTIPSQSLHRGSKRRVTVYHKPHGTVNRICTITDTILRRHNVNGILSTVSHLVIVSVDVYIDRISRN